MRRPQMPSGAPCTVLHALPMKPRPRAKSAASIDAVRTASASGRWCTGTLRVDKRVVMGAQSGASWHLSGRASHRPAMERREAATCFLGQAAVSVERHRRVRATRAAGPLT